VTLLRPHGLALITAVFMLFGGGLVSQAGAHAVVVAAAPPAGGQLSTMPDHFSVRFNSRVDHARSRLVLIGPEGVQRVLTPAPGAEPTVLAGTLPPGAAPSPGAWRLRWQVLAIDGHITRGDIPFILLGP
jgi:copper resistance protein C